MEGMWRGCLIPGMVAHAQEPHKEIKVPEHQRLRRLHCNVTSYIKEELNLVDATSLDQTLWMPTLNQAMLNRVALEDQLCALEEETAVENKVAEEVSGDKNHQKQGSMGGITRLGGSPQSRRSMINW